ncbi:MAG TPA: hypothetical protein DD381_01835 [Lentisphaeria bacterium]|nr:MAG: hypothetical protein A2X47_10195 [Lentisphaerae bacterium GWF2_38_69]HBM15083.1 hypothetical protein [Lentisphaeria bacterium]
MSDELFWKRKLLAYLHDPPDKALDILNHEENAKTFQKGAGFTEESERINLLKEVKKADHFASSAERFVFPKGKCSTQFNGQKGSSFLHPLSSAEYLTPENFSVQAGELHGILQNAVGGINTEDWRKKFFLYWRRWLENSKTNNKQNAEHLALLPADTRIPDHSIWNHISITSALAGCIETGEVKPAMLLFQLGPVQDFIAQARSTRDLWSGSYLLSWLIAHAMKAVTDEIGPDSIIFPSLRGNGIFDALHKDEVYSELWNDRNGKEMSTWKRMIEEKGDKEKEWLLTPTLPNRFLAIVSESKAEQLAKLASEAIQVELKNIGNAVWEWIESEAQKAECNDVSNWKLRWDFQIKSFPQISWAVQPWLDRETCLQELANLPNQEIYKRLKYVLELGERVLPFEDRDQRYYEDNEKTKFNSSGIFWSAHYALVDAQLAARRNTRDFNSWVTDKGSVKDSLSGKEEIIGTEEFWKHLVKEHPKLFPSSGHRYAAMNLIKRLWCRSDKVDYLKRKLGIEPNIRFDSIPDVAGEREYVAVLAMDGDEMGKWVSGEKTPKLLDQLSEKAKVYLRAKDKKEVHRLLTPSYHLQFSEALANFSTWIAGSIVEEFDGQLIYSGGDDVLAMLPADQAIACAEKLRTAFRDDFNGNRVTPGSKTDVSIGLAIGHIHAPLQMLVREAQKAEKRAKNEYKRSALAISLYKRSGEIIQWGCKWESVAIELINKVTELSSGDEPRLSGRFPYALAQILKPYRLKGSIPDMKEIVMKEFEHVVEQQGRNLKNEKGEFLELGRKWLDQTSDKLEDFANLFLVETFINRFKGEA